MHAVGVLRLVGGVQGRGAVRLGRWDGGQRFEGGFRRRQWRRFERLFGGGHQGHLGSRGRRGQRDGSGAGWGNRLQDGFGNLGKRVVTVGFRLYEEKEGGLGAFSFWELSPQVTQQLL